MTVENGFCSTENSLWGFPSDLVQTPNSKAEGWGSILVQGKRPPHAAAESCLPQQSLPVLRHVQPNE